MSAFGIWQANFGKFHSRRLEQLHGIPHLAMTPQVETLVIALIKAAALPEKAVEDAFHIALATVHSMDFLLNQANYGCQTQLFVEISPAI